MCGIAGIVDYRGDLDLGEAVNSMVHRLLHRGPDGRGYFVRDNVALGHTRLSIIDPEGGMQPMATADGEMQISFNGEINNFRELQKKLRRKGHLFKTDSDTEAVLYAYREWGNHCVDYLEGMFAFGIADFGKNEVFLARDPFGIKPLLYRVQEQNFVFASEFQAFWALSDWSGEIDLLAIDTYLRHQYIPAPKTAFRKVFKLPAGHRMTVRMGESHQKIERYWQPDFSRKQRYKRDNDYIDALDEVLQDSVRRHLVSDVPFGALLSGGVDSSLVVGYMAETLDRPVKTFSIGFEEDSVNELPYARQVADRYGTEHSEEIVRFDALEILSELVRHHGEPFGDQSAIPTWYVSKLARSEVSMVLSGDGGDELFAGYGWYGSWLQKVENLRPRADESWKHYLRPIAKRIYPSRYPKVNRPEDDPKLWTGSFIRFSDRSRESLWRPEFRFLSDENCPSFIQAFEKARPYDSVNRPQRIDLETFLPEDVLCKVDVSSMRHGLEVRPPMLDRQFFDVCRSFPADVLYSVDSTTHAYSGKQPLKRLLARKLDSEFANRPKQGFELPLGNWFESKIGKKYVRDRLLSPDAHISNWFNELEIANQVNDAGAFNLWLLLVLEEWCSQFSGNNSNSQVLMAL